VIVMAADRLAPLLAPLLAATTSADVPLTALARFGVTPVKLQDAALVLGAYLCGLFFLYLGYRFGGRTWMRRHGLVWSDKKRKRLISGFWPELLLFTAGAILVLTVDLAMSKVSLIGLFQEAPQVAGAALGFVLLIVIVYSIVTVQKAKSDPRESKADIRRLGRAYTAYAPYTVIFFTGGALVIYLLIRQFAFDQAAFEQEAAGVRALFAEAARLAAAHSAAIATDQAQAARLYAEALSNVEFANGRIALATSQLQEQMNPVFIFATAVFAMNILIRFTPARNAFLDGARSLTLVTTAIAIGFAALFGLYVYFWSYSQLLDDAIRLMAGIAPDPRLGEWDMTRRFNELLISLNQGKNLFGFMAAIGGEGSGLATFVFGVQFALGRIQDRELENAANAAQILSYADWRAARRPA
jgi:hypothetical protein